MRNEERNRIMDKLLVQTESWGPKIQMLLGVLAANAIIETDRKARAWDALTEWIETQPWQTEPNGLMGVRRLKLKMANLLAPPKPKSKLERLRDKLTTIKNSWPQTILGEEASKTIKIDDIITEIDRLEAEEQ